MSAAPPAGELAGLRILVTGATGLFGLPLCRALAPANHVVAAARFSQPEAREELVARGVEPIALDLADPSLPGLPEDIDVVFHLGGISAASGERSRPQAEIMAVNTHATGRLLSRYRDCRAFVYASSAAVYAHRGGRPVAEDDPYGLMTGVEDYALSKIASEAVLQRLSEEWGTPVTVLRIFQLYGPLGGSVTARARAVARGDVVTAWAGGANLSSPMFEDDYVALALRAPAIASSPPCVVNFGGSEVADLHDYCDRAGEMLGREVRYRSAADGPYPLHADTTRMEELLGRAAIPVAEGLHRVLAGDDERSANR